MITRTLFSALCLVALCPALLAQSSSITRPRTTQEQTRVFYKGTWERPEFGDIKEIADKTKVYVGGEDLEARKIIVKELAKDERLQIVDSADDCEFAISFGTGMLSTGASVVGSTVVRNTQDIGEFVVYKTGRIDEEEKVVRQRILWSTRKQRTYSSGITLNRHPATNATREFLRALEKARKEQAK